MKPRRFFIMLALLTAVPWLLWAHYRPPVHQPLRWDLSTTRDISAVDWPREATWMYPTETHAEIDLLLPDGRRSHYRAVKGEVFRDDGSHNVKYILLRFPAESRADAAKRARQLMAEWGLDGNEALDAWLSRMKGKDLEKNVISEREFEFPIPGPRRLAANPRILIKIRWAMMDDQWVVELHHVIARYPTR